MFEISLTIDSDVLDVDADRALELIQLDADLNGLSEEESVAALQVTLIPEHWAHKFPTDMLTADGKLAIITALSEGELSEEDWELFYDYAVHFSSGPIEDLNGILEEAREHAIIRVQNGSWRSVEYRLADYYMTEHGYLDQIPEHLQAYFDCESYGKDLMHEHVEGDYFVYWAG